MFEIDHVAIQTNDVPGMTAFYRDRLGGKVLYADKTWAFVQLGNAKLALVTPSQHPAHVAYKVDLPTLQAEAARAGKKIDVHRDGTQGIYIDDPSGNVIELIYYPPGGTVYGDKAN